MKSRLTNRTLDSAAYLTILLVGSVSLFSIMGLGPFILQDEMVYSFNSRFVPRTETQWGNFGYFHVYNLTSMCGEASYLCGKSLNSIFSVISAGLFYFYFSSKLGKGVALALSFLFLSGPFVVFQSLFMPEIMFTLAISLSLVFLSHIHGSGKWLLWAAAGSALALAALVKPHAFLILPGILLFILIERNVGRSIREKLRLSAIYLGSAVAAKLAFGFLLAGSNGLSLLGPAYQNALDRFVQSVLTLIIGSQIEEPAVQSAESVQTLAAGANGFSDAVSAQGPLLLLALVTILGPGIWFLLSPFFSRLRKPDSNANAVGFAQLVVLSLLSMTVAIILFTGLVTSQGDDHTQRTLFRYIGVLIPVAIAAAVWSAKSVSRWFSPAIAFTGIQIIVVLLKPFPVVSIADSAYIRAIVGESTLISLAWISVVLVALLAARRPEAASTTATRVTQVATASVAILTLAIGFWTTDRLAPKLKFASPVSDAARIVSSFEGAGQGEGVHFLGSVKTEVQGGILVSDLYQATTDFRSAGTLVHYSELPTGTNWVVSTQEVLYDGPEIFQIVGEKFKISLVGDRQVHFFGKDMQNNFVTSLLGFGPDSMSGKWITADRATMSFSESALQLDRSSLTLQFFCKVDCSGEAFQLIVNDVPVDVVGAAPGNIVSLEFGIDKVERLEEVTIILPKQLVGHVSLLMFEQVIR